MDFPTTFERQSTCPLIGQVERQDEYCDFTVEFGTWTKRFHRCVLAGSGFFETLFGQKEFIEQHKGSVHIHIGDKDTLEQALMFLYNKFPVLNMDNISLMLEMAEFLLIPTLKSYCVEWLNELTITRHIVWIILSLESLYDFQVTSLVPYLHEHLVELMVQTEMLQIDNQSLEYILTNKQLSYVGMDRKFDLLMRWTKHDIVKRKKKFDKLLSHIEFLQLSNAMIERARGDPFFEYSYMLPLSSTCLVDHSVAIIYKVNINNVNTDLMIVFDEHSKEWHKVESNIACAFECDYTHDLFDETVYHVLNDDNGTIESINPECNSRVSSRLAFTSASDDIEFSRGSKIKLCLSKGMCYQIKHSRMEIRKRVSPQGHVLADDRTNVPLDLRTYNCTRRLETFCLYAGNLNTMHGCTSMTPVLSTFQFDVIGISCWNEHVAMLSDDEDYLLLYNTTTCRLIQIDLALGYDRKLTSCNEGFLVFTCRKVICIMKRPEDDTFQSVSVDLFDEFIYERFEIFNDAKDIYIYKDDYITDKFVLGRANIKEAFTIPQKSITWKLVTPPDIDIDSIISIMSVKIPTVNARCHLLCPCIQCKQISRGIKRKRIMQCSCGFCNANESSNDDAENASEEESD